MVVEIERYGKSKTKFNLDKRYKLNVKNLANKFTMIRVLFIPVFIFAIVLEWSKYLTAIIFLLLILTDAVDGYIARKRYEVTTFGRLMDPLADKLLISAALIFLIGEIVQPWMVFVIIAREFIVTGIRLIASSKGIVISASFYGKLKTVSQATAIMFVILAWPFAYIMMLVTVALTVISGLIYVWEQREMFSDF